MRISDSFARYVSSLLASCAVVVAGCDGGGECELDTDCPVFQRCEANLCVGLGGASDAGPRRDGGGRTDASSGDGGTPTARGFVRVTQTDAPRWVASAAFYDGLVGPNCTQGRTGGCDVERCARPVAPAPTDGGMDVDAGMPPTFPSAGAIEISGDGATVVLSPGEDGSYANAADGAQLWSREAEIVSFSADGDDVPAFTSNVRPPSPFTLTTPSFETMPSVNPSSGLSVEWTGSVETLHVVVDATEDRGDMVVDTRIDCELDGTAGSGTVGAAALAELPLGPAVLRIFSLGREAVQAGQWLVVTELWAFGTSGIAGTPTQGAIVLQEVSP